MDLTKINTTTPTPTLTLTPAGTENEAPRARTQPNNRKSLSFTNGALKKRPPHHHPTQPPDAAVVYKECLKNHAAALGGHAVDGCGEFMPSPSSDPTDPTSLTCAACGCHRNFHRREDDSTAITTLFLPLQPPKPPRRSSPSSSPSHSPPPPPPHPQPSYYSSAPQMLLALSTAVPDNHAVATPETPTAAKAEENPSGRKRFRTKFTQDQKEKMFSFSEKLGWKMQKSDEGLVEEFCNGIGVGKGVLKVWMHNNKHTFGKREINSSDSNGRSVLDFGNNGNTISAAKIITSDGNSHNHDNHNEGNNGFHLHVSTSGSPSSA